MRNLFSASIKGSLRENTAERQPIPSPSKKISVKNGMSEKVGGWFEGTNFRQCEGVGYIPVILDWCAGAGWWYGVVSLRTRKGSTSESLAQETSAITATESAETRIIDFFMAGTVVDAAGQFNRRTPRAVKARNHFLMREMRTQDSVKNYMSEKYSPTAV